MQDTINDRLRRMRALTHKEFLEVGRDKSSLMMGILLPIILILVIGFGISLDVKNAPIAVVLEDNAPEARQMVNFVDGSEYFKPVYMTDIYQAVQAFETRKVDAILRVPPDFSRQLHQNNARLQLILYGVDTTTAMTLQSYVEAGVSQWTGEDLAAQGLGGVTLESRLWFNDAHASTWVFVPGLILMIVTLVGVLLTAGVMAREYERGTFESLFVTPVRKGELIVAKIIPYFCIAMLGVLICLVLSRYLFQVPLVGSLALILLVTILYLLAALGAGILISVVTKGQFMATQVAMLVSFLPSIMVSGFLFDLRSTPLVVQLSGEILPFSHYLTVLKTLFLAGNIWPVIWKQGAILVFFAILFTELAFHIIRKKVE